MFGGAPFGGAVFGGRYPAGRTTLTGAATLTITDTLTAAGRRGLRGAATLTITDTLTAAGKPTRKGTATLTTTDTLTAYGYVLGNQHIWMSVDANRGNNPLISVQIDFTNDPTNPTRDWTDITSDVRAATWTRSGRSDELQTTQTGTLNLTLNNRTGTYDPQNTGSPHYPGIKRLRWIRVSGMWNNTIYPRWTGLISSWNLAWPESGKDAIVNVTADDALKILNLYDLNGQDFTSAISSARAATVATLAGLPVTTDTGISTIVDSGTFTPQSWALTHLQDVEATENGRLFANAGGTIVFQSRHYRINNSGTPAGTVGDTPGMIPAKTAELDYDDTHIYNPITTIANGGGTYTASNAAGTTSYFSRPYSRTLLTADAGEALECAQYLLGLYSDPLPRWPALTLLPQGATALWPAVLAIDNSSRLRWNRSASWGTITGDGFVEQISETVAPGMGWLTTVQLSPTQGQTGWVLQDATFGVLGSTTVLSY